MLKLGGGTLGIVAGVKVGGGTLGIVAGVKVGGGTLGIVAGVKVGEGTLGIVAGVKVGGGAHLASLLVLKLGGGTLGIVAGVKVGEHSQHRCWCFAGSVTVQLASLENQESVDEHYPMVAVGGALAKGEVGSLRFRTHYKHQVLLPQAEYTSLKEVSGLWGTCAYMCVCVCVVGFMHVCVLMHTGGCVCVHRQMCMHVVCESVCDRERESVCVCVCVCA